ncbi:MAG: hypothetical protein NTU85_03495 [Candidatus Kaiserbacteria bacterium]|nr:hypothetical protein [Candidatus Kaiserbacteria bacterium]
MTTGYAEQPFGLRDLKLTNAAGTVQVDLPRGRVFKFTPRVISEEIPSYTGLDAVGYLEGADWELEAGGISLEAWALLAGHTAAQSGSTPNRSYTVTGRFGEALPWFRCYGKAVTDDGGDVHVRLPRCKVVGAVEGQLADGEFWVTKCKGIAVDDGTNGVFVMVLNETATALPGA